MTGHALRVERLALTVPGPDGRALPVLDVPHLAWPAGARIALLGPSGSGKTSLIGCLAGLIQPAAGSIRWDGLDIAALPGRRSDAWRRRHVGLVFQDFHLVPELDARENVLLPARFEAWRVAPALHRRADDLLERVGIGAPRRRAGLLSRGEQQRVGLARALLHRPAVLLADEPTASLDAETGRTVADLLLETAAETGATLCIATHDPALAGRLDGALSLALPGPALRRAA